MTAAIEPASGLLGEVLERASDLELWERFQRQLRSAGYCRRPVRLRGQVDAIDLQTGETRTTFSLSHAFADQAAQLGARIGVAVAGMHPLDIAVDAVIGERDLGQRLCAIGASLALKPSRQPSFWTNGAEPRAARAASAARWGFLGRSAAAGNAGGLAAPR